MPGNRFQDIYGWMIQNDIFPKYQFTVSWCFFTASWLNSLVARMHIDSSARYLRFWNEAQLSDFTAPEICLPVRHELSQLVASSNLIQKDPWYKSDNWNGLHLKILDLLLTNRLGSLSLWMIRLIASNNTWTKNMRFWKSTQIIKKKSILTAFLALLCWIFLDLGGSWA